MDNRELYDDIPYDGGVPIRGAPTSAEEGASEGEEEVDIDDLRRALRGAVVVPRQAAAATPAAPSRLSFHLPNRDDTLGTEEEPNPGTTSPLEQDDGFEQEADHQSYSTDPEDPVVEAINPDVEVA